MRSIEYFSNLSCRQVHIHEVEQAYLWVYQKRNCFSTIFHPSVENTETALGQVYGSSCHQSLILLPLDYLGVCNEKIIMIQKLVSCLTVPINVFYMYKWHQEWYHVDAYRKEMS